MSRVLFPPTRTNSINGAQVPWWHSRQPTAGPVFYPTWTGVGNAQRLDITDGEDLASPVLLPQNLIAGGDMNYLHLTIGQAGAIASVDLQLVVEAINLSSVEPPPAGDPNVVQVIQLSTTVPGTARWITRNNVDPGGAPYQIRLAQPLTFDILKLHRGSNYRYHLCLLSLGGASGVYLLDLHPTTWKES